MKTKDGPNAGKRIAKEELELKQQREIAESLKYASYIQKALFPTSYEISRYLPDHFLFFQPCHVVSGDFYFITGHSEITCLAVGDCTGHGVPGAFMSILGITFLNSIISHYYPLRASMVLNQMREHVMKALSQTGTQSEQKDGIDMAFCLINHEKNNMEFSGAFNPIYRIRNKNIQEFQGDKMPVGIGSEQEKPFSNKLVDLEEGDMIYLFSDGFVDQFGGKEEKKFKYRSFRELLISISDLSVSEQKNKLQQTFDSWKGNLKQLDDVLVFGFRYHAKC
jgi:serine phosphatase RsbU (regulator of sigma subunit)